MKKYKKLIGLCICAALAFGLTKTKGKSRAYNILKLGK